MSENIVLKARGSLLRDLISLLLCSALACPLGSCTKTDISPTKKITHTENILRYDVNAPFTSLNPTTMLGFGSVFVFPLLYSFLFVPDANGDLKPDLAGTWTYDAEHYAWTIHLRENVRFHNGHPVTSKDVEYSLETMGTHSRAPVFALIKRVSISSDTVLTIHLNKDDPEFLKKIWDLEIVPQPNGDTIDYYNHPIGSGPFKFAYRKGEKEVSLVANEDYYGGRASLDGVVFYYQSNKEKGWTRLLSGKTDIVQEISPKNYEMIKQCESKFYFDCYMLKFYTILLYNTNDSLFSDQRVRLALAHAIDRKYIVENILGGCGVIAVSPLGVDSPYHNPEVKPIPCNPRKALRLFEQAGWFYDHEGRCLSKNGKPFEFTVIVYDEQHIEKEVARYIKLCLNDIGIKVQLRSLPFEEIDRRCYRNDDFQAVLTDVNSYHRTPESLQHLWTPHGSGKSDAGCFEHPEVTSLMHSILAEKDPSKRKELFYRIDTLITSLQPGTFLFQKTAMDVMSKRFTLPYPFCLTHEGIHHLKYASLTPH